MCSFLDPYLLKDSEGCAGGTKSRDLKETSPSATKCDLAKGDDLSPVKLL